MEDRRPVFQAKGDEGPGWGLEDREGGGPRTDCVWVSLG